MSVRETTPKVLCILLNVICKEATDKPVEGLKEIDKKRLRGDPVDNLEYLKGCPVEKKVLFCCTGNKQGV